MFSLRCVRALTLALQCALLARDSTLALEIIELLSARCHPLFGMPEKSSLLLEALLSAQVCSEWSHAGQHSNNSSIAKPPIGHNSFVFPYLKAVSLFNTRSFTPHVFTLKYLFISWHTGPEAQVALQRIPRADWSPAAVALAPRLTFEVRVSITIRF